MEPVDWGHLLHPVQLQQQARAWLQEDTPSFDYGGLVVGDSIEEAVILAKSAAVLAGAPFVDAIFRELDCTVEWLCAEGVSVGSECGGVTRVGRVRGKVRHLLLGERVALNVLTRASGIATGARDLANLARSHAWHGSVAGTRKTTPGFRCVEKHALLVGGLDTHRYDLSSMVMLKDNHIWATGNIALAVKKARQACGFSLKIEVECRSVTEAFEAASAGADVIMLDNFSPEALHPAAAEVKTKYPHVLVEASGGVTSETLARYFGPNVDVISMGATTQGYRTADFSMKICKEGRDPSNPRVEENK